ncbi:MAG: acyl carrier protein [Planctomycetaceae bacterium]|mgnify:FL=1|nr:acyl carrier protein [Planctomycetaceae bacterium]|tara:strand:- start:101 stop:481 length:381 start_codon:yes stop_codon:yes gene_type:complete
MPSKEEVFEKVRESLVDALGVDDDEVTPEATLVGDLGAESIDFLDIVFRLEKSFDIKIPRGELFPEDILTNTDYVVDGKINAEGLTELKKRMPFADLSEFEKNPVVQEFATSLTVQDMCNYVESKV